MPNALANLFSWADGVKRRVSSPLQTIALGLQRGSEDLAAAGRDDDIAYGQNGMNSVLITAQQRAQAAQRSAEFGANMGLGAATVWHGSPHKFDKFDSSKIGTGEGAQAYGHGLYLAESDKVANEYATMFNKSAPKPASLIRLRDSAPPGSSEWKHYDALLNEGQSNLYKVDLPDNAIAKMLDWDKPLSQQAPEVRQYLMQHPDVLDELAKREGQRVSLNASHPLRLQKIPSAGVPYDASRMSGNDAMTAIQQRSALGKAGGVEQQLRQAGIPGIRYLDGGSRGAGQGSSNYVVFPGNENLLSILERNGVPTK